MKGKIVIIFLIIFLFQIYVPTFAVETSEDASIDEFLDYAKDYAGELFPELQDDDALNKVIDGTLFDKETLLQKVFGIFVSEIETSISIAFKIISVSILCSLLKNIQSSEESSVGEVAFYICYLFVITLVFKSYADVAMLCQNSITKLSEFMNFLTPLVFSLLLANGGVSAVTLMQPVLILMTNLTNTLICKIILPIIFISMIINVIGNINENIQVSKLPSLLQKASVWMVNMILGIFIGILSLEGTLAASVDGVTVKTAKTVVSTVIPVVGKALSDATDSIIGAATITKNALGILGVVVVIAVVLVPIIKAGVMMIVYNLSAALVEPLVDKRMSKCISEVGSAIKILVALMCTVSVLFIIAITLLIKVGNFTLMYR